MGQPFSLTDMISLLRNLKQLDLQGVKMLKVGIVGVGQFGQNHARILNESTKCNFIGLFDKDKKRAEEISSKLNTKSFKDFDSLIYEIDILFIVSPPFCCYICTSVGGTCQGKNLHCMSCVCTFCKLSLDLGANEAYNFYKKEGACGKIDIY